MRPFGPNQRLHLPRAPRTPEGLVTWADNLTRDLDRALQDIVGAAWGKVTVAASRSANQAVATATPTDITFPTVVHDYGFSFVASGSDFTCELPGVYVLTLDATWASATATAVIRIEVDGTRVAGCGGSLLNPAVSVAADIAEGSVVTFVAEQSSGGPINITAAKASITKIGASG